MDIVTRGLTYRGTPVGLFDPATDPEVTGVLADPLEGVLDADAGHGTFIAGLIHQTCPDADILSIRVMPSDGAVPEHVLLDALTTLAVRQHEAQQNGDPRGIVDVVCLSLGYYHELPADSAFDPLLLAPIDALARMGVAVVASAGNDSTDRPMYPAGFAPHPGGEVGRFDADCVPVLSVGALNPNGSVALFSNAGDWVTCYRPGAGLVSTFPTTFNAAQRESYGFDGPDGPRATIDPDDFSSGFGTWSGTSFAAPLLAAEIAQKILDGGCGNPDDIDGPSSVTRSWAAVSQVTDLVRPS
jgi:subtilisin family serine protease